MYILAEVYYSLLKLNVVLMIFMTAFYINKIKEKYADDTLIKLSLSYTCFLADNNDHTLHKFTLCVHFDAGRN